MNRNLTITKVAVNRKTKDFIYVKFQPNHPCLDKYTPGEIADLKRKYKKDDWDIISVDEFYELKDQWAKEKKLEKLNNQWNKMNSPWRNK